MLCRTARTSSAGEPPLHHPACMQSLLSPPPPLPPAPHHSAFSARYGHPPRGVTRLCILPLAPSPSPPLQPVHLLLLLSMPGNQMIVKPPPPAPPPPPPRSLFHLAQARRRRVGDRGGRERVHPSQRWSVASALLHMHASGSGSPQHFLSWPGLPLCMCPAVMKVPALWHTNCHYQCLRLPMQQSSGLFGSCPWCQLLSNSSQGLCAFTRGANKARNIV